MVCIFFVISGYALSLKPIKQIRARQLDSLLSTMTSSIFRRGIRLFLPCFISTFMVVVMIRLGWYEQTREFAANKEFLRNVIEHHPKQLDTLYEQLCDWTWDMFQFVHIWEWKQFAGSTGYDLHLWTIPVEFRASMMLFLTIIGLARVRVWIRFVLLLGCMYFVLRSDRWEMFLFYSGMLLAEVDVIRDSIYSPPQSPLPTKEGRADSMGILSQPSSPISESPTNLTRQKLASCLWILLGLFALYLMSQPDDFSENTPGWIYLCSLIPEWFTTKYRFWQSMGSVLFVFAASNCAPWRRPLETPLVQYLGKISYAIYLVHGPLIHVFGYVVEPWAWSITGTEGWRYHAGFVLGAVFIIPTTFWAADLFWRFIDTPCVKLARWVEKKCAVE